MVNPCKSTVSYLKLSHIPYLEHQVVRPETNYTHMGADSAHDPTQSRHFWTGTGRSLETAGKGVGVWMGEESRGVS